MLLHGCSLMHFQTIPQGHDHKFSRCNVIIGTVDDAQVSVLHFLKGFRIAVCFFMRICIVVDCLQSITVKDLSICQKSAEGIFHSMKQIIGRIKWCHQDNFSYPLQTSAALKCGIAAHTMSAQENVVRIDLPFFTDFRTFTVSATLIFDFLKFFRPYSILFFQFRGTERAAGRTFVLFSS